MPEDREATTARRGRLALAALVVAVVAIAHGGALGAGFVSFDDDLYVYANPQVLGGLTPSSIAWAFRLDQPRAYYHPLTWLSLQLDASLFGPNPRGYHLVNLALHAVSAVLLLRILLRATRRPGPSVAAALLFAAHPLTVEVVAWVTERKAVLSTALLLGALAAYLGFVERRRTRRLAPVIVLVVAAVLAKPSAVVAPALMLLLDLWPLGRLAEGEGFGWRALGAAVGEKVPIIGAALAAFAPSLASIRFMVAEGPQYDWPMGIRLENAVASIPSYLRAFVWPSGLSVYRLFPERIEPAVVAGAGALVVIVTLLALRAWRRWPFLLFGWGWFLAALVPYLGIVRAGLWPAWADRFAYVPLMGLAIATAFGAHALLQGMGWSPRVGAFAAVLATASLAVAARAQGAHWRDSVALFARGAAMEPGSYVMTFGLARELVRVGRFQEAVSPFEAALRIYPTSSVARAEYAVVLARLGRAGEAAVQFQEALRLDRTQAVAAFGYAELLESRGLRPMARTIYREWARVAPDGPATEGLKAEARRRSQE